MAEFNLIVPGFLLDYRSVTLYQEWLNLGNEGTMADFIAWLRTPATEAAGIALQAAATANVAIQEMATALQEAEETAAAWAQQEAAREAAEASRQTNTGVAIANAELATQNAINATDSMLSQLISLEIKNDLCLYFKTPDTYDGIEFEVQNGNLIATI